MTYAGTFLNGQRVAFSKHALERLVEMGIAPHQIELTLCDPDETYSSEKYPGTVCYRRGELAMPVEEIDGELTIITALYATVAAWQRAYDAGIATEAEGRGVRDDIRLPRGA